MVELLACHLRVHAMERMVLDWAEQRPHGTPIECDSSEIRRRRSASTLSARTVRCGRTSGPPAPGPNQLADGSPIGPNTFPQGRSISVIHPRSDEGAVSLYIIGLDGKVWSNFCSAAGSIQWSGWFPVGNNNFPI